MQKFSINFMIENGILQMNCSQTYIEYVYNNFHSLILEYDYSPTKKQIEWLFNIS